MSVRTTDPHDIKKKNSFELQAYAERMVYGIAHRLRQTRIELGEVNNSCLRAYTKKPKCKILKKDMRAVESLQQKVHLENITAMKTSIKARRVLKSHLYNPTDSESLQDARSLYIKTVRHLETANRTISSIRKIVRTMR